MIARATHQADEAIQDYTDEEIYGQPQVDLKHAVTQGVWQLRLDRKVNYVSAEHSQKILGPAAGGGDPLFHFRIRLFPRPPIPTSTPARLIFLPDPYAP